MQFNFKVYIIFFLSIILLTSCSVFNHQTKTKKTPKQEKNELTYKYSFFEGNKQEMLGNYPQAIAYFAKCIELNKNSAASNYEIAKLYFISKEYDKALLFAKVAANLQPNNYWYSYLLASIYEETNDNKKAEETLKKLADNNPKNFEIQIELAQTYLSNNKINDALKLYNKIEDEFGVTEEISLKKQSIYLYKNENEKANNELKKLIINYPNEIKYKGLLAESYISEKKYDEAYSIYKKLVKIDSTNGLIQFSFSEYYDIIGKHDSAFYHLKLAMATNDFNPKIKIRKMYYYMKKAKNDTTIKNEIIELFNIIINTKPVDIELRSLYANFLIQQKEYKKARDQVEIIVEGKKDDKLIWEQLIYLDNEIPDYLKMSEHSNNAIELFPNYANFYYLNGLANFLLKDNTKAINSFTKSLPLIIDDNALKIQVLTYLGDAYYRLKKYEQSDSTFDEVLKIDKTNNYVLNNYSYYLSLRNTKLKKAEEMSKKCIDKNPNNYTYIDTYAWVLYKQNNYEKAIEYLKKAVNLGGNKSAVILEHLGDALYKNNNIPEAIEYWKKAKTVGKGTKFLDDKIKYQKLIE